MASGLALVFVFASIQVAANRGIHDLGGFPHGRAKAADAQGLNHIAALQTRPFCAPAVSASILLFLNLGVQAGDGALIHRDVRFDGDGEYGNANGQGRHKQV